MVVFTYLYCLLKNNRKYCDLFKKISISSLFHLGHTWGENLLAAIFFFHSILNVLRF